MYSYTSLHGVLYSFKPTHFVVAGFNKWRMKAYFAAIEVCEYIKSGHTFGRCAVKQFSICFIMKVKPFVLNIREASK